MDSGEIIFESVVSILLLCVGLFVLVFFVLDGIRLYKEYKKNRR